MKKLINCLLLLMSTGIFSAFSQEYLGVDSISVRILPRYDSVSNLHRKIFGENYRKEYSMLTRVPIIRLSQIGSGLKAIQKGGGFQTKSLRLEAKDGQEWVLRSIEKYPEILLPPGLRETFVKDLIKDNMSAQNPFSALIVPILADAIGAPHSNPVIGWVAPDPGLGSFAQEFQNTICLLEEREPSGKSDNTAKMHKKLRADNDNTYDAQLYLKLKCLDVLIGDWDRHDDQWRWKVVKSENGTHYQPVARDRDQVFYRSQGLVQRAAQSSWFLPMMQGYEKDIKNINWFLWEGREINSKWFSEIDRLQWNEIVKSFCNAVNDEVLTQALKSLPEPGYSLRKHELFNQLRERRNKMPELMDSYYQFFNKVVDIELTDKNESVDVTDGENGGITVSVKSEDRHGRPKKIIYHRNFDPLVTREVRLYLHNGNDIARFEARKSKIRVRVIAEHGLKDYHIETNPAHLKLYGRTDSVTFSGSFAQKLSKILSNDTLNTRYLPKDLYKRHLVYPNVGYNNDDGLALGLSFKFTNPGFRKVPFANAHSLSFLYSWKTGGLKLYYTGEWLNVAGQADFLLQASVFAPSNTQNFFGLGNQTPFQGGSGNLSYYRARFNLYDINPALRWRKSKSVFTAGIAYQHYTYNKEENNGRFISMPELLHSADSLTVKDEKMFIGTIVKYRLNTRDNNVLPSKGVLIELKASAYQGFNHYSNAYGQLNSSLSFYKKIDSSANFVITDRIGGGITVGRPAFYQAQFLGGQGNLSGYRQYRFAGEQSLFNNLEMHFKLGNFVSYVLPGEIGMLGLYDIGRVWKRHESSNVWHHGVGGGLYFAPASLSLVKLMATYSKEGWYPYFSLTFAY
ncbi:BamA/TamA family outer membrane protein [Pedobacter sp.]|uniref:BamA/TamA family outer membrane protein n=1 Tax=Pedobacter sp. TaxID=1411316 RepID=UPI003C57722B